MAEELDKNTAPTQFEELPDAPPRRRLQLSWSGKVGICVVAFWALIVVIGPYISPYHDDGPERDHAHPELAAPGELEPAAGRRVGQFLELRRRGGLVELFGHAALSSFPTSGAGASGSTGLTPCPR